MPAGIVQGRRGRSMVDIFIKTYDINLLPLPGVFVTLDCPQWDFQTSGYTDSNGVFWYQTPVGDTNSALLTYTWLKAGYQSGSSYTAIYGDIPNIIDIVVQAEDGPLPNRFDLYVWVYKQSGGPLAGASVTLERTPPTEPPRTEVTGSAGGAFFYDNDDGYYTITITALNYQPYEWSGTFYLAEPGVPLNHSATLVPIPSTTFTVTIKAATGGYTIPGAGAYPGIDNGDTFTVKLTPSIGYYIQDCLLNGMVVEVPDDGSVSFVVDENKTVTPRFAKIIDPGIKRYLTIQAEGKGTTTPAPGVYEYTQTTEVTIVADSDDPNAEITWFKDGVKVTGATNTFKVKTDSTHVIRVVFGAVDQGDNLGLYIAGGVLAGLSLSILLSSDKGKKRRMR